MFDDTAPRHTRSEWPALTGFCGSCQGRFWLWFRRQRLDEVDESAVNNYLAHMLKLLAKRAQEGRPVGRCEAITGYGERCWQMAMEHRDGHKVCTRHGESGPTRFRPLAYADGAKVVPERLAAMDVMLRSMLGEADLKELACLLAAPAPNAAIRTA